MSAILFFIISLLLSLFAASLPITDEYDTFPRMMFGVAFILCIIGWICWFLGV